IIGGGHVIEGGGDPLDLVAFDAHGNMLAKCLREFNCEKSLLSPSNPSEFTGLWKYTISLDLAEIATIVAGGTSASNRVASLTFATVPEPSTYALLVLGLACM